MTQAVLVTGAFGNMGARVLHYLLEAGYRVVALDLKTPRTEAVASRYSAIIKIIWGDICDPTIWPGALRDVDTVVHLASILPPFSDQDPERAIAVNETATLELIRQMEATGVNRLVFASSMILVGPEQHTRTPPLSANIEPRPTEVFGETKAACERAIRGSSLHWSILRFAVCPPNDFTTYVLVRFEAMFHASPDGRLEIIHPEDAGLAIANTLSCTETVGRILLVGGGKGCQTLALTFYNRVLSTLGLKPLKPEYLRSGPAYFFGDWLDSSESQKLLHYQRYTLDDLFGELRRNIGYKRWLLMLISPIVSLWVGHLSRVRKKRESQRISLARTPGPEVKN